MRPEYPVPAELEPTQAGSGGPLLESLALVAAISQLAARIATAIDFVQTRHIVKVEVPQVTVAGLIAEARIQVQQVSVKGTSS